MNNTMLHTGTNRQKPAHPAWAVWLCIGLLIYMALVGFYFVFRYQGQWAESDSTAFNRAIRALIDEGQLVPAHGDVYPNGYAYQVISAFIVALTDLNTSELQQLIYPIIAALVALPAWITYRELTGSGRGAAIATILLFTQPEFLFVILRSSHEKFTRTLLLMCLFWLARSLKHRHRPGLFAAHIVLFYLVTFTFITSNNLLAHSFIFAVAVTLLLGWVIERRSSTSARSSQLTQRLTYAVIICLGLTYIFTFYAYQPAQHDLLVLQNVWDRIAALFLDVQRRPTNAYAQVASGWVSLPIYFLVSIANWLILATSFYIWARQGWRWISHRTTSATQIDRLIWLLYGAFAIQGALSVISDASGSLSSNLQHRIFPSFSIIAVALVGKALAHWHPQRFRPSIKFGLSVVIACIAGLSVLKATNDPALSNKWTFYRAYELSALDWTDAHSQHSEIWTEFDERLTTALAMAKSESQNQNRYIAARTKETTSDFLLTSITRLRSTRLQATVPVPPDALQVYDNGEAQLYHRRPLTPYQK